MSAPHIAEYVFDLFRHAWIGIGNRLRRILFVEIASLADFPSAEIAADVLYAALPGVGSLLRADARWNMTGEGQPLPPAFVRDSKISFARELGIYLHEIYAILLLFPHG